MKEELGPDQSSNREEEKQNLSLLQEAREALAKEEGILVMGEVLSYPNHGEMWRVAVEIVVASQKPIHNPENDAVELNNLMIDLSKRIPPASKIFTARAPFRSNIEPARLEIYEEIGKILQHTKRWVECGEPDVLQKIGMVVGESADISSEDILRKVIVSIYPDVERAREHLEFMQKELDDFCPEVAKVTLDQEFGK